MTVTRVVKSCAALGAPFAPGAATYRSDEDLYQLTAPTFRQRIQALQRLAPLSLVLPNLRRDLAHCEWRRDNVDYPHPAKDDRT